MTAQMTAQMTEVTTDILVFGGGIAGLLILEGLAYRGFGVLLVETGRLGGGQTMAAQGIIHSGAKYALQGRWPRHARALLRMPALWRERLAAAKGAGICSCPAPEIVTARQHLFFAGADPARGRAAAGRARGELLDRASWPPFLRAALGPGALVALAEPVIDVGRLLRRLAARHSARLLAVDGAEGIIIDWKSRAEVDGVTLESGGRRLRVRARRYLFAAGAGNEAVAARLPRPVATRRRPLRMVVMRDAPGPASLHVVRGAEVAATITTHVTAGGEHVWYLGGGIAERGTERGAELGEAAVRAEAAQVLAAAFPGLALEDRPMVSVLAERAEPLGPGGGRVAGPTLCTAGNLILAWPLKLAAAPELAERVLVRLEEEGFRPGADARPPADWPRPKLAAAPWETAAWR